MEKPTIKTIDGNEHKMIELTGRAYRILAEFDKNQPLPTDADYIERHAAFVAEFYDGVTKDDVLDMPLDDILPAAFNAQKFTYAFTWRKVQEISKNFDEDKEQ